MDKQPRKKRNRATALVVNDEGKLLLVKEKGAVVWSLPGGGMKKREEPLAAARRELDEETGLAVLDATFLFHYENLRQRHHVCLVSAAGKIKLQRKELNGYRWWNGQTQMSLLPSATEIIARARQQGHLI